MNHFLTLAQFNSNSGSAAGGAAGAIFGIGICVLYLAIIVLVIAGMWKVFVKAGQPGWAAIVPIYNIYILLKIIGQPWWWLILCFIPLVNIVASAVICWGVSKSFGKDVVFAVLMFFFSPIMICILGFGKAKYLGPQKLW